MTLLPLPILGPLVVGGAALLALIGLLFVRRTQRRLDAPRENEVAGFLYAVIGVIYGVVIAFIVLVVWERFDATDEAVTAEAADLVAVFRDTQRFPDPQRQQAQDALRAYANEVINDEWRSWTTNGVIDPHTNPDPLNPVWAIYRRLQPETAAEATEVEHANERLHVLERQRHLRHLAAESTLPPLFWPVLIAGGILTVGFSYFFRLENVWVQGAMTALLASLISGILLLIVSLNQPFTGPVQVDREPFRHALEQFNALNLPSTAEAH